MVLSPDNGEPTSTINIQPPIAKPSFSMHNSQCLKGPSDDVSSASGGGKRQKIDLGGTSPEIFQDSVAKLPESESSSEKSLESGGSPAKATVSRREMEGTSRPTYGSVSVIGRRRTMEDTIVTISDLGVGGFMFSGVYDGHGGTKVSNACKEKLHGFLFEELQRDVIGDEKCMDWEKVMRACFKKIDEDVIGCGTDDDEEVGSTTMVAVVGEEVVVVANCGNSRVVLCRGRDTVALSRDHKPDRPDERARVEASGGRVINRNGSLLCGVLTTSRSIGDKYLKPYVTSDPEVTVTKRTKADKFLIIASDGLWDVVSNEVACDIVMKCFNGYIARGDTERSNNASEAAAKVAELAIAKGSKDNISVIIVKLNASS